MGRRDRLIGVALAWTLVMLAIGLALAAQAVVSLNAGQQACFFAYPAVACPGGDDPAVVRLTFAFFGVPLLWLLGVAALAIAWARRRRRSASAR